MRVQASCLIDTRKTAFAQQVLYVVLLKSETTLQQCVQVI